MAGIHFHNIYLNTSSYTRNIWAWSFDNTQAYHLPCAEIQLLLQESGWQELNSRKWSPAKKERVTTKGTKMTQETQMTTTQGTQLLVFFPYEAEESVSWSVTSTKHKLTTFRMIIFVPLFIWDIPYEETFESLWI
jgi:hypothetical protein